MQASQKVAAALDHFGRALTPEGLSLVQRLFAEAKWKAGRTIGEPGGEVLSISSQTRPLTSDEEQLIGGWLFPE